MFQIYTKNSEMIAEIYLDTSNEGDIVVDFFAGSGTCFIAAERTNRICYGTEIEAQYCQSIIRRLYKHCQRQGSAFDFAHLNGNLTLKDILNGQTSEPTNA